MTSPTTAESLRPLTTLCAALGTTVAFGLAACTGPAAPPDTPVGYKDRQAFISAGTGAVAIGAEADTPAAEGLASAPAATLAAEASTPMSAKVAAGAAMASASQGAAPAAAATIPETSSPAASGANQGAPSANAPASTTPVASTPPAAMAAQGAATPASSNAGAESAALPKASKLTVAFTTKSYGGRYQPVNLGAVWIEDASGQWVYTLEMWCGWQNTKSLVPYNMSGGADYSVGLFPGTFTTMPPSDVITSATLRQHKAHSGASWSFKNSDGQEAPDGMYKLMLELTEEENAGKVLEVPFMKGAPAGSVTAPNNPVFTNLKIELQ